MTGYRQLNLRRRQIDEARDRMFMIFNESSDDDRYDIHCHPEAPTGSTLKQRVCRPEFLDTATRDVGRKFLADVQGAGYSNGTPPVNAVLEFEMPRLHKKMEEVARETPELLEAMAEMLKFQKQYKARSSTSFVQDA